MKESDGVLARALRSVFKPLANLLLKNHISASLVIEQLKIAYVEAAYENHGHAGKPASVNRIARLTGMSRGHVSALLEKAQATARSDRFALPRDGGILSTWANSSEFTDGSGRPRALDTGPGPGTFQALVQQSVGKNDASEDMQALLDAGSIRMNQDGRVEIVGRMIPVSRDLPGNLEISMAPLAYTIDRNWSASADERFLQRVAHSGRVNPSRIPVVRRIAMERSARFIEEIDDMLSSHEAHPTDSALRSDSREVGVGVYYFEVETEGG